MGHFMQTVKVAATAIAVTVGTLAATAVTAQDQTRLGSYRYWSSFTTVAPEGKICWAATSPLEANYGGSRGDPYLMVAIRPGGSAGGEVSLISGFEMDESKTAQARIGSKTFSFFTLADGGWLETSRDDQQMIAAMRAGSKAEVTGYAATGGTSRDTFSLLGFTAAYNAAREACG